MECDKLYKKSCGGIGPSYDTLSSLVKELKNESILMLQLNESDFSKLAERVVTSSIEERTLEKDFDKESIDQIFSDSKLASSKMYSTFVNYYILRLTAVLELYFKDSIKQLLKLNIDLLTKGFKKNKNGKRIKGLPKKIDENYNSKKYLEYLNIIAEYYSSGKKFSGKYRAYSKFLKIDISDECILDILGKLDNLFSLRNDLAHLNRFSDDDINKGAIPHLETKSGFVYSRETPLSTENFREVVIELVDLTDETSKFLQTVEQETNLRWCQNPDNENPECHYARLVQKINQ